MWIVLTLLVVPMYMFSPAELAPNEDQGVVFGALDVPANATLEQLTPYTEQIFGIFKSTPEFDHSFQITFPIGGFGGMLVKPWDERKRDHLPDPGGARRQADAHHRRARAGVLAPALPSAGIFPVEFVIASTASHEELLRFARQLVAGGASRAASSRSRRSPTCGSTRPRPRSCSTATRSPRWASACSRSAPICRAMLGGNFVNRFNIDGRSYKVIAADRARRRGSRPISSRTSTSPVPTGS